MFYLAGLSYPLTVEEGEAFIHRLRMPTRWARVVRDTITVRLRSDDSHTDRPYIGQPDLSPGQLSRLLEKYSPIGLRANAMLTDSLQVKEDLKHYLTVLHHVETSLDGRDLIALGVAQGPQVGEVLRELKDARIDGTASSREDEIRLTQEYSRQSRRLTAGGAGNVPGCIGPIVPVQEPRLGLGGLQVRRI